MTICKRLFHFCITSRSHNEAFLTQNFLMGSDFQQRHQKEFSGCSHPHAHLAKKRYLPRALPPHSLRTSSGAAAFSTEAPFGEARVGLRFNVTFIRFRSSNPSMYILYTGTKKEQLFDSEGVHY